MQRITALILMLIIFVACSVATDAQINALKKHLEDRKFEEAIAQADKLIEANPENAELFNLRGVAHTEMKNFSKATEDFGKAIELNGKNYKAFYNRGLAKIELKLYESALEDFDKSIQLDATVPDVYLSRGTNLLYLKRNNEALADFIQGLKLRPSDKNFLFNKAVTHGKLANYDAALHDLHECVAIDPDFAKAHYFLAVYHLEVEKKPNEEICEHLNKAIALGFKEAEDLQKEVCAGLEQ